ncbi:uncharacterized protein G2W53_033886 [Senna tora]|uniref:Uncharacterized protein n=1 Tax=Senna tora TaxID=362788 RepID=A0A834T1H3_9FABA|nr:uncharacterized protein G2W53_033886 [Senna tora]
MSGRSRDDLMNIEVPLEIRAQLHPTWEKFGDGFRVRQRTDSPFHLEEHFIAPKTYRAAKVTTEAVVQSIGKQPPKLGDVLEASVSERAEESLVRDIFKGENPPPES